MGRSGRQEARSGTRRGRVAAEFERTSRGLSFTPLAEPDTYAPEVGFSDGFPAARDPKFGRAWLVHCYGMVGAGRDNDVDSGGGTELYAVIGQAPRHLDRNVTLVGRVVQGMELLSALPRGTGALGFYEKPEQRVPIKSFKVAADVPASQRTQLEVLRTDTQTFTAYVEARRNRHEEWFKVPAGHVDVCNVPIPVRPRAAATPTRVVACCGAAAVTRRRPAEAWPGARSRAPSASAWHRHALHALHPPLAALLHHLLTLRRAGVAPALA